MADLECPSPPPTPQQPPPLPDWSELQRDALETIFGALEIQDTLTAAAVCTKWRTAAAGALGRALTPRRVHWLVLLQEEECWDPWGPRNRERPAVVRLYDILSGRIVRAAVPGIPAGDSSWWIVCSSSLGWLVVRYGPSPESQSHCLVNPFTGARISLPVVPCPKNARITTAVISGDPSRSGDHYAIMLACQEQHCIVSFLFLLSGDDEWRTHTVARGEYYQMGQCISYQGKFITVSNDGAIVEWDIGSMSRSKDPPEPRVICQFPIPHITLHEYCPVHLSLLVAPWGDLLLVQRISEKIDLLNMHIPKKLEDFKARPFPDTAKFAVFTVDLLKKTFEETESLQGHTMFMGMDHCCLISSELHPGLLLDSILFFAYVRGNWQVLVYNMTSGTIQPLPPSLESTALYHQGQCWSIFPSNGGFDSKSTNGSSSEDPNGSSSKLDKFVQKNEREQ